MKINAATKSHKPFKVRSLGGHIGRPTYDFVFDQSVADLDRMNKAEVRKIAHTNPLDTHPPDVPRTD